MLAGGYVFSGLFAFLQTLAFPGAYSANGLIGDGTNSPAWLFVLWHSSFLLAVIVYALSKDETLNLPIAPIEVDENCDCNHFYACNHRRNNLASDGRRETSTNYLPKHDPADGVCPWPQCISMATKFRGFHAVARPKRTVLDLWLLVILVAWWPNFLVGMSLAVVRFSFGWYIARFFALLATSTLLFVLLAQSTLLYARLANAILLLRRERADKLMSLEAATTAIAHEIGQPLAAISSRGGAALNWLRKSHQCKRGIRIRDSYGRGKPSCGRNNFQYPHAVQEGQRPKAIGSGRDSSSGAKFSPARSTIQRGICSNRISS